MGKQKTLKEKHIKAGSPTTSKNTFFLQKLFQLINEKAEWDGKKMAKCEYPKRELLHFKRKQLSGLLQIIVSKFKKVTVFDRQNGRTAFPSRTRRKIGKDSLGDCHVGTGGHQAACLGLSKALLTC